MRRFDARDSNFVYTAAIRGKHFEPNSFDLDKFTGHRNMTQFSIMSPPTVVDSVSAEGLKLNRSCKRSRSKLPGRNKNGFGFLPDVTLGLVLIPDLAKDLLDQIFHSRKSGRVAVFIDHDDNVAALTLHFSQEIE